MPKIIPHTNKEYAATAGGQILSLKFGKIKELKQSIDRNGYMKIHLYLKGSPKFYQVHRAVYMAFYGRIPDGMVVDHINHNRTDNSIANLQLLTWKDNARKARDAGRTASAIEAARRNGRATAKGPVKQSGVANVYWNRFTHKWFGARYVDGVRYATKHFNDIESARKALFEQVP